MFCLSAAAASTSEPLKYFAREVTLGKKYPGLHTHLYEPARKPSPLINSHWNQKIIHFIDEILKRKCRRSFWRLLLKMDWMRPSLSYKLILEQREERNQLNSWKEQLVICSSAFWKQKCENLKNVSLTFFKFQSILAHSVSGQRH